MLPTVQRTNCEQGETRVTTTEPCMSNNQPTKKSVRISLTRKSVNTLSKSKRQNMSGGKDISGVFICEPL